MLEGTESIFDTSLSWNFTKLLYVNKCPGLFISIWCSRHVTGKLFGIVLLDSSHFFPQVFLLGTYTCSVILNFTFFHFNEISLFFMKHINCFYFVLFSSVVSLRGYHLVSENFLTIFFYFIRDNSHFFFICVDMWMSQLCDIETNQNPATRESNKAIKI